MGVHGRLIRADGGWDGRYAGCVPEYPRPREDLAGGAHVVVPGAQGASACGFEEMYGVYVPVRGIVGTGARAHVHIVDSVAAFGL
jgi:hypothetical protein